MLMALEPLLLLDAVTGEVHPNLCSIEAVDDLTYRFTVRSDVRFWDGSPMTVDDVKFSIDIHRDPSTGSNQAWVWDTAKSVDITGEQEITVVLKRPQVTFRTGITQTGVVKRGFVQNHGDSVGTPDVLNMSTGPYKPIGFQPGQSIDFERNENYWGTSPPFRRLTMASITDPNTALASIGSGQLTGNFNIPRRQLPQYKKMKSVSVYQGRGADYATLAMNTQKPPFDDIHVRRAVAHCIDKETIVSAVYHGAAEPARTLIARPLLEQIMSGEEISALAADVNIPYDMNMAAAELAKSSHPDGFSVEVLTNPSEPALKQVALILQKNLQKIGISLSIKEISLSTYAERIWFRLPHEEKLSIVNAGYFSWTPFDQLLQFMTPSGLPPRGYQNIANIKSEELTRLWREINSLQNYRQHQEEAAVIVKRMLEINHDTVSYPGIAHTDEVLVMNDAYRYEKLSGSWLLGDWYRQIERR